MWCSRSNWRSSFGKFAVSCGKHGHTWATKPISSSSWVATSLLPFVEEVSGYVESLSGVFVVVLLLLRRSSRENCVGPLSMRMSRRDS